MKKYQFQTEQLAAVLQAMSANGWKENRHYSVQDNILTIFQIDMTEAVYFEQNGGVVIQ